MMHSHLLLKGEVGLGHVSVLILVVMDDALALSRIFPEMVGENGS